MTIGDRRVDAERSGSRGQEPADPRELAREIAQDARSRGGLLIFADFERTLCLGAPNGRGAGLPLLVRGALVALVSTPATGVVINSGQDVCDLETHVNVPGLIYAGCRGLQIRGAGMSFCHPAAARLRQMLPLLAEDLSQRLASLTGVEVEIKDLGIRVHVRRADPSAVAVIVAHAEALRRTFAGEFRVWPSGSTVDLFPDAEWRTGAGALWILEQWAHEGRGQPAVVYLGHDRTDEDAYRALREHGYAVHVGPLPTESAASCWVADQAAAFDLLAQIALAWSVRPADR
jgi:trehalose 6-phosphate phosphatase